VGGYVDGVIDGVVDGAVIRRFVVSAAVATTVVGVPVVDIDACAAREVADFFAGIPGNGCRRDVVVCG